MSTQTKQTTPRREQQRMVFRNGADKLDAIGTDLRIAAAMLDGDTNGGKCVSNPMDRFADMAESVEGAIAGLVGVLVSVGAWTGEEQP